MKITNPRTDDILKKLIPAVTVWVVGKVLEAKPVQKELEDIDRTRNKHQAAAIKSVKRVAKNAASNRWWLTAGAAAILVGIGMLTKAGRD